jgi:hypothetical protein
MGESEGKRTVPVLERTKKDISNLGRPLKDIFKKRGAATPRTELLYFLMRSAIGNP